MNTLIPYLWGLLPLFTGTATLQAQDLSPEQVVQKQVEAYNELDIDHFLSWYDEDIACYNYANNTSLFNSKKDFGQQYGEMFAKYPKLHCEILNRMVLGNKVIDHERITGIENEVYQSIAIYEVKEGKILKVTFLQK